MQNYPNNINPAAYCMITEQILPHLIKKQTVFLEFGCSTGALGHSILKRNIETYWIGLDHNNEALAIAQPRLSQVIKVDFSKISHTSLTALCIQPDILIMVDILEHIYEPDAFLKSVTSAFPNPAILCVLPNIACYQTYDRLSKHNFSYDNYGIFDKTHKTFYTYHSAQSLFNSFGYSASAGPLYLPDPEVSALLTQNIIYPYTFTRSKYSIRVDTHDELFSLCSYSFCFIFNLIQ